MEKFFALTEEKQKRIIEAGLYCFGKMGYKKTSAQDVAQAAGISKGMIFHYFGNKKGLYQTLIQVSFSEVMNAFGAGFDASKSDFFDRIEMLTRCKIDCLKKHPSLLSFLTSLYAETDPEVAEETQKIKEMGRQIRMDHILKNCDRTKFKRPEYADLAWKLLMSYGENCADAATGSAEELAAIQQEFSDCVFMLKGNLYRQDEL